jgi:ABC-type glycerol-3-phosphate transport system substrate-binding protein
MAQRDTEQSLADRFMSGRITRREFVIRLGALGLSLTSIAAIIEACSSSATPTPAAATATPAAASAGASMAASAPASAAASGPWAPDPTTLTGTVKLYKGPFVADEVNWQQQNIDLFHQKVPNVEVDFSEYDWSSLEAQVQASLASGEHDVIYLPEAHVPGYQIANGPLEDIHPYLPDPGYKAIKDTITQATWDRFTAHDGTLGGLPMGDGEQSMLVLNVDLFKKAGVDMTSWNSSYDNMTAAAQKIAALGSDITAIYIRENGNDNGAWYDWYGYLLRAGGDFLNAAWTDQNINIPEFAQALQMIQDWHVKYKVCAPFGTHSEQEARALFVAGKVGMVHTDNTWIGSLTTPGSPDQPKGFTLDCAKFPPGPKADVFFNQGGMYVMSAKSQNKPAAWEVLKHWARPWRPYDEATGNNPVVTNWKELGYFSTNPIMAKQEALMLAYPGYVIKNPKVDQFQTVCTPIIDQVYAGKMTPQQALDQCGPAIVKALNS